jgi:tRNA-uridine 2-sulfurtransferase
MTPLNSSLYQKRIAVAMSGGVDSSVTAALLRRAGAEVRGVFMRLAQPEVDQHQQRAVAVAAHLGIELTVLDLAGPFREKVLQPFIEAYFAGLTPNPCVFCNRLIKFGLLLETMLARQADFLATGHYVRLTPAGRGGMALRRGLDPRKDQSYFLCRLPAANLSRILFPLGEKRKSEVYELAATLGLSGRHGAESQDVCFMGEQTVADFLAARLPTGQAASGRIVSVAGRELGRHQGIHRYTVGQRRGLGIPDASPYYVVALDAANNRVVVGKPEDLLRKVIRLADLNWLVEAPPPLPTRLLVQLRHRHQPAPALVEAVPDGTFTLIFDQPQRAPAPGQYAALYRDDQLLAGGEILPDH